MNRDLWFRLLQIGVVAPFIYSVSEDQNAYFRLGLKLVAGAIILKNIEPVVQQIAPLIAAAARLQAENAAAAQTLPSGVIEGEFTVPPSE